MPKPKTVSMRSIRSHTYDSIERPPDTVYDVDELYAESLIALGFAMRAKQAPEPKPATASAKPKR